ncbi:MAG: hypothetical protein IIA45_01320, partial [Bacteroidetes bacterium]|nr:hypothetical protein [Bacteroidota bacterium]
MKRIIAILSLMITFVLVVGVSSSIIAQSLVPQGFNYQAVARDAAGEPIANQLISMKISVVSGSANGQVNYTEVHGVTTNEFGLITLTVGSGKPLQGDFKDIPWSEANQWLKIAMDTKGGEDFLEMGASQILTSPYAFYAETAGTIENPDDPGGDSRAVDWNLAGNTGSTPGTHYIGTTDSKAVLFKTDGTERMRISATGDIGVNVIPQAQFHIKGSGAVMEFAIEATAGNPDFTL